MRIVDQITHFYASGLSLHSIAQELNNQGLTGSKGGKFYTSTIQKIINNPIYEIHRNKN
jgi:hypothetical protein